MKSIVILAAIVGFGLLVISFSGMTSVETGHRGIKVTFGKVVDGPLSEGLYFYNPFTTKIIELDTRTQLLQGTTVAYTKDVQQAAFTYAINLNLDQKAAVDIFQSVGVDWADKLLPQVVEGSMKQIIGQYEAVDFIAKREKATAEILRQVQTALQPRGIDVTNFAIKDVQFSDDFEKAVEAKVTAVQRASEAQNKTVQVQEEARQRIIQAEAEAKSMQIRAEALTQNRGLVEYEAVQKWNGILPTMIMGDGAIPFINVPHQAQ